MPLLRVFSVLQGNKHSSASPDYNKLFTVVGNVFKSGNEADHQQMIQQLKPSQRQGSRSQQSSASSLNYLVEAQDEVPEVPHGSPRGASHIHVFMQPTCCLPCPSQPTWLSMLHPWPH